MPQLQVHPSAINFGHLVCEHQLVHHSLTISNAGLKEGKFSFLIGQLPNCVTVSPLQGTLKPGQALDIKVIAKSFKPACWFIVIIMHACLY